MTMSESFQPTAMEYAVPSLPEACVSLILSFTSPLDACRAAAVSSSFLSAAQSDVVWSRFLPPDYLHILSRLVSPLTIRGSSKKELYFLLCSWVLLDGGKLVRGSSSFCWDLVLINSIRSEIHPLVVVRSPCFTGFFVGQAQWEQVLYVTGKRANDSLE